MSGMQITTADLALQPFFKGMSPAHLEVLARESIQVSFAAGESIFREGDPANRFYLIQSGKVELLSEGKEHGNVLIETIGAGDVLGWSWLFPPYYWNFSASAVEPTQAIFFYGTRLREQSEANHSFGYELMKRTSEVVIKRLQSTRRQLLKLKVQ